MVMLNGGQKKGEVFMRHNRKGFTGIELIILVGVIGLVSYFAAPAIGKAANNIFSGGGNRQKQMHKVTEQYSMFYKDDKGNFKPAPVPYKRTEEALNYINAEPPETLWQKFMKLGAIAVAIIALLSYLGLWPIIALWWNKKVKPKIDAMQTELESTKSAHAELKGDAKLIVMSVDEGLATLNESVKTAYAIANAATDPKIKETQMTIGQTLDKAKADFLTAMSKKQDTTTKNLVRDLLKND
jgi:competence protein ComGC